MATTISTTHSSFLAFPIGNLSVRGYYVAASTRNSLLVEKNSKCRGIRAVDEETVAEAAAEGEVEVVASEQPVWVTVSPSDLLTMFFQAELRDNEGGRYSFFDKGVRDIAPVAEEQISIFMTLSVMMA